MKDRFKFTAESSELEILIYGSISSWNISARYISDLLRQNPSAKTIKLRINSLGGSVFEGAAIYNVLARHAAKKEVDIDGVAASAASWIVMAGDVRRIGLNGFFMIHEASGDTWGPAVEHERTAVLLRKMNAQQVDIYAKRSKLARADIAKAIEAETWYSAAEALKAGFVTEVADGVEVASAEDLEDAFADYGFKNAPEAKLSTFFSFAASSRRERIPAELLAQLAAQAEPSAGRAPSAENTKDNDSMNKKLLAQKLGISESASDEAFEAAIVANADRVAAYDGLTSLLEDKHRGKSGEAAFAAVNATLIAAQQLPGLVAKVTELEAAGAATELDKAIAVGVKAKKVTPAIEASLRKQMADKHTTLEGVKATIDALPEIKALVAAGDGAQPPAAPPMLTADDGDEPKHNGKSFTELSGSELKALKQSNAELYAAMAAHSKRKARVG